MSAEVEGISQQVQDTGSSCADYIEIWIGFGRIDSLEYDWFWYIIKSLEKTLST